MFGILVVIVIILWAIASTSAPSNGSNGGAPSGLNCQTCKSLPFYWKGLSFFQRFWMLPWFGYHYLDCLIRGC